MNKLSQYLEKAELTQFAFAQRIGVAQATVSRLASGQMDPSMRLARKIAKETNGAVSVADWRDATGDDPVAAE